MTRWGALPAPRLLKEFRVSEALRFAIQGLRTDMQSLLLINPDASQFNVADVERAFRFYPQFSHVRLDDPCGSPVECRYEEPGSRTTIRLSADRKAIFIDHTWGAALTAVLLIQKALGRPLRVFNDDYTFDLTFSDIATVEELEAAMEKASTS